eukprot:PhM_4_TR11702/c2_g1_i3/m.85923
MSGSAGLRRPMKALQEAQNELKAADQERHRVSLEADTPERNAQLLELEARCATLRSLVRDRLYDVEQHEEQRKAQQTPSPSLSVPTESSVTIAEVFALLQKSMERHERVDQRLDALQASVDTQRHAMPHEPVLEEVEPSQREFMKAIQAIAAWPSTQQTPPSKELEFLDSTSEAFGESKTSLADRRKFPRVVLPFFLSLDNKAPRETKGVGDRDTVIRVYDTVVRLAGELRNSIGGDRVPTESRRRAREIVLRSRGGAHHFRRASAAGVSTILPDDAFFIALDLVFETPVADGGLANTYTAARAAAICETLLCASFCPAPKVTDQELREFRTGHTIDVLEHIAVTKTDISSSPTSSSKKTYVVSSVQTHEVYQCGHSFDLLPQISKKYQRTETCHTYVPAPSGPSGAGPKNTAEKPSDFLERDVGVPDWALDSVLRAIVSVVKPDGAAVIYPEALRKYLAEGRKADLRRALTTATIVL